jgi:hypothetical protein
MATGWTVPGDWWVPAVDAVAEAVEDGLDPSPACARLGRARAEAGVGLDEAFADLGALHAVLGSRGAGGSWEQGVIRGAEAVSPEEELAALQRALALGWAEEACAPGGTAGCEDPLTGLVTRTYLRTRLGEVYREAERRGGLAADGSVLLVTDPGPVEEVAGMPVELTRLGRELTVAESVRAAFSGGETLCALSPVRVVALVAREPTLPTRVAGLSRLLAGRLPPGRRPRIWVEGLPPTLPGALRLLEELAR